MTSIRGTEFRHNYRLALVKAEKLVRDPHRWLALGQPLAFDGLSPVQVIEDGRTGEVLALLAQLEGTGAS